MTHATQAAAPPERIDRVPLPVPFVCLALGMLISYLPVLLPFELAASVSYLGWMIPLVGSAYYLATTRGRMRLPVQLWLPWIGMVIVYTGMADAPNALQRGVMLVTPLVVGAAFSAISPDYELLQTAARWLRRFLWIFLAAAGVSTGLLSAGALYETSGFATGSITASLLASWYAVRLVTEGKKPDLGAWLLLSIVPVLANTRTGMVAVAVTLPLVCAPWPLRNRLLVMACIAAAGLVVFQSSHVQSKMFYSGHGTLGDAIDGIANMFDRDGEEAGDFATSGRLSIVRALRAGVEEAYWLGHGANSTEAISMSITGVAHPHNDWLRLQYEYGTLGLALFGLTLLAQAAHAVYLARRLPLTLRQYLYAGATAFLPMALFMFSDNVILYIAWFGNLQFALLGLGYAVAHTWLREASADGRV